MKNDIEEALNVITAHLHSDVVYTTAITHTTLGKLIHNFLFSGWLAASVFVAVWYFLWIHI